MLLHFRFLSSMLHVEEKFECWNEYLMFGGMPLILSMSGDEEKSKYLLNYLVKHILKTL